MSDSTRTQIITQPKSGCEGHEAFRHAGSECDPPIHHHFEGGVTHRSEQPIVQMHLWNEECVGQVNSQLVVRGDAEAPVIFSHHFPEEHRQSHRFETALSEPIHHALQMRTPLQVRFCNSWQVASDYSVGIDFSGRRLINIRLTGATVATPQPCQDDCPPPRLSVSPASGPASGVG